MPFTPPNTYTDATPISADDVRENHEALRRYLNRDIVANDIDDGSIDWTRILAGEFASVTADYRLTTGNHYSRFEDADPAHQSAIGLSMKTAGLDVVLLHPILGATIRVEKDDSMAIVRCFLRILPELNDLTAETGISDNAYLVLDGELVDFTLMRFFAPEGVLAFSDAGGNELSRIRECPCHTLLPGLSAGTHTIEIRVDPRHDLSLILSRGLYVEVLEV